jgi:RHS repeat-associated protein
MEHSRVYCCISSGCHSPADSGLTFDAASKLTYDGNNTYAYDYDGSIRGAKNESATTTSYVHDDHSRQPVHRLETRTWLYDTTPASMTSPAACAIRKVSLIKCRSTGKERDTESGNDYFGARYYSSTMGRFMSPDWSAKAEPVPYSALSNPQSLNLYT